VGYSRLESSMSDSSLLQAFASISSGLLLLGRDWKKQNKNN
jgi:hypothetical protein